jgi:hypothetical protein
MTSSAVVSSERDVSRKRALKALRHVAQSIKSEMAKARRF